MRANPACGFANISIEIGVVRAASRLWGWRTNKGILIVAKPELGSKHQCESCSTKFFDLNKDPILCPRCGAEFLPVHVLAKPTPPPEADKPAEDEDEEDTGAEIIPLDEADDTDDGKVTTGSDSDVDVDVDVDVDDDDDDEESNDAFLEEDDDDNNDVSGLIDGDIAKDEDN